MVDDEAIAEIVTINIDVLILALDLAIIPEKEEIAEAEALMMIIEDMIIINGKIDMVAMIDTKDMANTKNTIVEIRETIDILKMVVKLEMVDQMIFEM